MSIVTISTTREGRLMQPNPSQRPSLVPGLAYTWGELLKIALLLTVPPWGLLALLMLTHTIQTPATPFAWLGLGLAGVVGWGAISTIVPATREMLRPREQTAVAPLLSGPAVEVALAPPAADYRRFAAAAAPRLFGRGPFLAELVHDLCRPAHHRPLALTALQGLPGIGKTALALNVIHAEQVIATFPDGQFWIALGPQPDLRLILVQLIEALGGSAEKLTPDQSTALLNALLAGKRLLLVLDDVWQTDHARPFLEGCALPTRVLFTTRHAQLADDLNADTRAVWTLAAQPSLAVLAVAGTHAQAAVDADTEAARTLAERVGHLPLALEVAGRYLNSLARADGPRRAITTLLAELDQEESRVLRLRAADPRPGLDDAQPSLEAVLALSYQHHLPDAESRRAFRTLAVFGAQPRSFDLPALLAVWQGSGPQPTTGLTQWRLTLADAGLLHAAHADPSAAPATCCTRLWRRLQRPAWPKARTNKPPPPWPMPAITPHWLTAQMT